MKPVKIINDPSSALDNSKNSDDTFIRPKHDSISVKGILFQNQSLNLRMAQFYGFYPIFQQCIQLDQRG